MASCDGSQEKGQASNGVQPLHRLAVVRKRRKLSLDEAARRLKLPAEEAERQEQATNDLTLSVLYRWQQMLKVPVGELLVDGAEPLGLPAVEAEKLSSVLRVALLILHQTKQPGIRRMAHTLVDQLVELSPGLRAIAESHTAGQAHRFDDQGRALKGSLPLDFFMDPIE
jgi:transcriptional regulator with XRE-family HTH domain